MEDDWEHAEPPAVSRGDRTGGHCAGTRQARKEDGTKKVCGGVWVKLGELRCSYPPQCLASNLLGRAARAVGAAWACRGLRACRSD